MNNSESSKMVSEADTPAPVPRAEPRLAPERKPGRGFLARIGVVLLIAALALLVWYAVEVLLLASPEFETRRAGTPMSVADAWVAATALHLQLPLVTHNRTHFAGVAGLTVISES